MAKSASLKSVDFSLALALSKLGILLCVYLIYRQHIFNMFLIFLWNLISFMP